MSLGKIMKEFVNLQVLNLNLYKNCLSKNSENLKTLGEGLKGMKNL